MRIYLVAVGEIEGVQAVGDVVVVVVWAAA